MFTVNIGRAYNWKDSFKIDSAFTAFERNTAFQIKHVKVVPFGNRRYTSCESGTFCPKLCYLKGYGVGPQGGDSPFPFIKLCWAPSAKYQSDEFSIKPTCMVYWWYLVEPRPMKSLGNHSGNCLATQQNDTAVWARKLTWRRWERPAERRK